MPIYEYECALCHNRFERKQRYEEEPLSCCPGCGGKAKRVLHSIPVIFKGSGFYVTDSRKEPKEEVKAEKSETKPAASEAKATKEPEKVATK